MVTAHQYKARRAVIIALFGLATAGIGLAMATKAAEIIVHAMY